MNVFLTDYTAERFAELNAGYLAFWGPHADGALPARITTGTTSLGPSGASVEVSVVARP